MALFVATIVGLMLGSLLSVLIGRWPHFTGVVTGRSHCPHCMHELAWYDLVPLFSWLMLRGRCRYCNAPISAFYPVLELSMGAVLGVYAYTHGIPSAWSAIDLVILFALVSLFFFDLKHQMLPDVIVLPLGVVALLRLWLIPGHDPLNSVVMCMALVALFGGLYAVSRGRWLGFGDVKLAFVIGVLFGFPEAVGVTLVAIWAGALVGLGMMVVRRASMTTALPFGSFWTAAAVGTMLWAVPAHMVSELFFPILR